MRNNNLFRIHVGRLQVVIKGCPEAGLAALDFRRAAGLPDGFHNRITLPEADPTQNEQLCRAFPHWMDSGGDIIVTNQPLDLPSWLNTPALVGDTVRTVGAHLQYVSDSGILAWASSASGMNTCVPRGCAISVEAIRAYFVRTDVHPLFAELDDMYHRAMDAMESALTRLLDVSQPGTHSLMLEYAREAGRMGNDKVAGIFDMAVHALGMREQYEACCRASSDRILREQREEMQALPLTELERDAFAAGMLRIDDVRDRLRSEYRQQVQEKLAGHAGVQNVQTADFSTAEVIVSPVPIQVYEEMRALRQCIDMPDAFVELAYVPELHSVAHVVHGHLVPGLTHRVLIAVYTGACDFYRNALMSARRRPMELALPDKDKADAEGDTAHKSPVEDSVEAKEAWAGV